MRSTMSLSLLSCLAAGALLWVSTMADATPAVLELFTSEGCSSCPPAEAYIGELTQRGDVLALTFHVDYWDDLGWLDRFALPSAVQRQRAYAKNLGLSSVYTPQAIIDGHQNFVGSDRTSIGKALARPRSGAAIDLSLQEGEVRVELAAQQGVSESEVLIVAYQRTAVSPIGRGENAGRTLREFNVVRDFRTLGRWQGRRQEYRWRISSLPPEATDAAVVVQGLGQASIIGAASIPLH
jgi:hypothetical protein